jgi:hypothetical protein
MAEETWALLRTSILSRTLQSYKGKTTDINYKEMSKMICMARAMIN